MSSYDIIIIGGGINSLTAAAKLGKSGKKVVVFESRENFGGIGDTSEFVNGFKCNSLNDSISWLDPRMEKEFALSSYGLKIFQPDPIRIALDHDGNHIRFYKDIEKTINSISNHSKADGENWTNFNDYILNLCEFLKKIYKSTPPNLPNTRLSDLVQLKSLIKPIIKQGTFGISEFMRTIPMMMPEMMDEWFKSDLVRGVISAQAVKQLTQGPYASAVALNLLHHHVHSNGIMQNSLIVSGGTKNIADALVDFGNSIGVKFNSSMHVESILLENNCCQGVQLSSGEKIYSTNVLSGLDPWTTFNQTINPKYLSPEFNRQIKNIKCRGSVSRIHLALRELPKINGIESNEMSSLFTIAPSLEYIEKAFDSTKYGEISEEPVIEFFIPSILNQDFAPKGKHVLSITLQYTPYQLRNSDWDKRQKNNLYRKTLDVCKNYIPDLEKLIEEKKIVSPVDIENDFGIHEGSMSHGDLTLDQFYFMRPIIRSSKYETPIKNLYLCGSGVHPGGGLHGANGINAAKEVLKQ